MKHLGMGQQKEKAPGERHFATPCSRDERGEKSKAGGVVKDQHRWRVEG